MIFSLVLRSHLERFIRILHESKLVQFYAVGFATNKTLVSDNVHENVILQLLTVMLTISERFLTALKTRGLHPGLQSHLVGLKQRGIDVSEFVDISTFLIVFKPT